SSGLHGADESAHHVVWYVCVGERPASDSLERHFAAHCNRGIHQHVWMGCRVHPSLHLRQTLFVTQHAGEGKTKEWLSLNRSELANNLNGGSMSLWGHLENRYNTERPRK